jgi:hypothetical protein
MAARLRPDAATNTRAAGRMWHYATADGVPRRSLIVAMVVGTVLNLINQGDAIVGANAINWLKIGLTYVVPYCVCTYGAVSSRLSTARAETDNQ